VRLYIPTAASAIHLLALVTFAFWPHYRAYYEYKRRQKGFLS